MKRNLQIVACLLVLSLLSFAVFAINQHEKQQEMQREYGQEVLELKDTINRQQMTIRELSAEVERQELELEMKEEVINMKDWQLWNLEPSDDR